MHKICGRCQNQINCNTNDIESCECNTIELLKETTDYLKNTSYDCLCKNCLEEVNKYPDLAKKFPFPDHPSKYVLNVHYYMEEPYWIFTNFYHYLKGKCCKNNCRHCAYGYKK